MNEIKKGLHHNFYGILPWRRLSMCVGVLAVVVMLSTVGSTQVYADIQSSAKLAETGTEQLVKIIGNSALFICICLFGITQFFGVELGRWGKRLIFSAILGSAVILNATFLRDLIWGNVGG